MSPTEAQLDKLEILFRRTSSLPPLSSASVELIRAIDSDDTSTAKIEHVISSDPALAAKLLRLANSASQATSNQPSASIRESIVRVGFRSVRTLALSLLLPGLGSKPAGVDGQRCVRHSLFTAFLSRYLFVRHGIDSQSAWTTDEIFAAGLLHDLGYPLLSHVDESVYERVCLYGRRTQASISGAFEKIYEKRLGSIAALACEAWQLPEIFGFVMNNMTEPWKCSREFAAISCVCYADYLANLTGVAVEDWPMRIYLEPEVREVVGLPDEEVQTASELINGQVEEFLTFFHSGVPRNAAA